MQDLPILDASALDNLRSINPEEGDAFVREIAGIFMEDTPACIHSLDSSLAAGDQATFVRMAHSIKGSSANLGASRLKLAAEMLEQHAKGQGLAGTDSLLANLKGEYQTVEAEIRRTLLT